MDTVQSLVVKITADAAQLDKALDGASKKIGNLEGSFAKLKTVGSKMAGLGGKLTAGLTVPIAGVATAATKAASDMEENIGKINVVFGQSANQVLKWADTMTEAGGLSKNAAMEAISGFGDMATAMGMTKEASAKMGEELVQRAADLASFKNISQDQAMTALNGIFTGQTESLKSLGVVMTQVNLEKFAADNGLVYKNMSEAEKVQLRYNYVMEQTKNAAGDYSRTSDGLANSMRTMKADFENASAALGQAFLPIVTPVIQKIADLANKFNQLSPTAQKVIGIILLIVAAIGPMLVAIGSVVSAVGVLGGAIAAATVPILPIVVIIAGIVAAIIAVIAIVKNWGAITEWFGKLWANFTIKIQNAGQAIVRSFKSAGEKIKRDFDGVKNAFKNGCDKIKGFFSGLKLKLPRFKLPHFKLNGSLSLNPIRVPHISVDWYAKAMNKGMILNSPTIFGAAGNNLLGAGQAGPEAVIGVRSLKGLIDTSVKSALSTAQPTTTAENRTIVNLNGSYMFEDKQSMDYFLNRLALAMNR